jgi:hypothetical protein
MRQDGQPEEPREAGETAPGETAVGEPPARGRVLSPAAVRALAEAAERRKAQEEREAALAAAREVDGRGGRDPVRYSDWEIKGIASDF